MEDGITIQRQNVVYTYKLRLRQVIFLNFKV